MRAGIFVRLWRWLFGDPVPQVAAPPCPHSRPPQKESTSTSTEKTCAAPDLFHGRCPGLSDPRCQGGNCTRCCLLFCAGRCWPRQTRIVTEQTATMGDIAAIWRSAPGPEGPNIIACACGQKNRVSPKDLARRPICGTCRAPLKMPP